MSHSFIRLSLVPRLLLGILAGIAAGAYLPTGLVRALITLTALFAAFLKFVIPLIILAFVIAGIAELTHGTGWLLALTTGLAYGSTILAALLALAAANAILPRWLGEQTALTVGDPEAGMLQPYFTIQLTPLLDVTAAIVLAFLLGLGIAALRARSQGQALYQMAIDGQELIKIMLNAVIIPLLPIYIAGTFANITISGQIYTILSLLWKVFCLALLLHLLYLALLYAAAGSASGQSPLTLIKNQAAGYLTALGTQSSAATIPINLQCAAQNGVSPQIRQFVIPLCATIHLSGSIISLTCFAAALLHLNGLDHSAAALLPFLLTLGVAMIAAPGAPGGAIMSALPFLPMIGIAADGPTASLMIALYITQDSFGTAANVSGDNALAVIIDTIYRRRFD